MQGRYSGGTPISAAAGVRFYDSTPACASVRRACHHFRYNCGEIPRPFETKNKRVSPVHPNAFLRKLGLPTDPRDREILAAGTVAALYQCEFGLTDRDLVVIGLCVHGNKHRHIAEQLGCSIRATHNHLNRAFRMTGTHSIGQLAQWALSRLEPPK